MKISRLAFIKALAAAPIVLCASLAGCGGGDDQEIPKSENAPTADQWKEMEEGMKNMTKKKGKK